MLFWFPLQRGWPESEIGKEPSWPLEWSRFGGDKKSRSATWGLRGLCESVLSPSGFLIFFPRICSLLTHFALFSDIKPNYMGTQGWTCVCVWYMCVCECVHVCVHKCECVLVKVKVAQSCPTLCDPMCYTSPWNSPGKNTGVGRLSLIQGIFPTQGLNPGLPHCRWILHQLSHKGNSRILEWVAYLFSKGYLPNQESNWGLLHCRWVLHQLSYQGNPRISVLVIYSV